MHNYTREDIIRIVEEEDVALIWTHLPFSHGARSREK